MKLLNPAFYGKNQDNTNYNFNNSVGFDQTKKDENLKPRSSSLTNNQIKSKVGVSVKNKKISKSPRGSQVGRSNIDKPKEGFKVK